MEMRVNQNERKALFLHRIKSEVGLRRLFWIIDAVPKFLNKIFDSGLCVLNCSLLKLASTFSSGKGNKIGMNCRYIRIRIHAICLD